MEGLKNRRIDERIDIFKPIRSMSYNCPGHKERMQAHCERVEREKDKFRVLIKLFDVLFKRADKSIRKAKKSYIISCHRKLLEELKYCKIHTFQDIRRSWT